MVRRVRQRGQGGFALVLALVLMILGLSVAAIIGFNLLLASRNLARQAESVQIAALLDAGMALALAELHDDSSWSGTTLALESGQVRVRAGLDLDGDHRRIELEATYRSLVRRAAARVRISSEPPVVTAWSPYAEALAADPLPLISPPAPLPTRPPLPQ